MSEDDQGWQPLSVRTGRRDVSGPFEGLPKHLQPSVKYWLEGALGYRTPGGVHASLIFDVGSATEVPIDMHRAPVDNMLALIDRAMTSEDLLLDVIDAMLHFAGRSANPGELKRALRAGRSVWTVRDDERGLARRVDEAAVQSIRLALAPADLAAAELASAWDSVYGLKPDASDGWDHAIKAIEAVLIPVVCPEQQKATLGHVLRALRDEPSGWSTALSMDASSLVAILELLWPNPDRHGGPPGSNRAPLDTEGRAAVHLAVTIVQWARDGFPARVP